MTVAKLRVRIDHNQPQAFPWKLQTFSRLQSSKVVTSDGFFQCSCCLAGGAERQIPGASYLLSSRNSLSGPDFLSGKFLYHSMYS